MSRFTAGLLALVALCGCSEPSRPAASEEPAAPPVEAREAPASGPPTAPVAGTFRSGRPITLPEQIAPGTAGLPVSAKALALRSETVAQALAANLGDAASGIDVRVERGVVHLGGEVASVADYQKANYVARALDGVIEVDQSEMRVAR